MTGSSEISEGLMGLPNSHGEVTQIARPLWRNVVKGVGKITVRIDQPHSMPEGDVLPDQIAQEVVGESFGLWCSRLNPVPLASGHATGMLFETAAQWASSHLVVRGLKSSRLSQ